MFSKKINKEALKIKIFFKNFLLECIKHKYECLLKI